MKYQKLLRFLPSILKPNEPQSITEVLTKERNIAYQMLDLFYTLHLPKEFIQHRKFFNNNNRGFGEDAFHSMWYLIFKEFKPQKCLEIGVYRGQVITLWRKLSNFYNYDCEIGAISPFSSAGDTVSKYLEIDYYQDTINNHLSFNLQLPKFCSEYSTAPSAIDFMKSEKWDLIYIDGSHDYEIVKQDLENSITNLSNGGLIVMDDSSLYFDYTPNKKSFAGHPGPSKVAKEIAQSKLKLLGGVGHNNVFQKV
jgi:Methyltransferase domain